jgi:hypothetical protein
VDKRLILPQNIGDRRDVYFVKEDRQFLRKHASSYHPKIAEYIEKAKPIPNLIQVLLTALGAYEFWGQNVNGDRFRVPALTHEGSDYGYQTFTSNANYFTHHVNKDPALAKGQVLHAVWNEAGKRVELIVGINPSLDPEGAAMVDRGDDVTFSMGAKVPFDVCSICHHRAKTRAEYCDCLRYMMNQIDPMSNQLVGADNLFPKFFDISRVLIPADKTAHMWTKVASALNPYRALGSAQLAELPAGTLNNPEYLLKKVAEQQEFAREKLGTQKISAVSKNATITKRVEFTASPKLVSRLQESVPTSKALLQETSPSLSEKSFEEMAKNHVSLQQLLSTMAVLGMEPTLEESGHILKAFGAVPEHLSLGPTHFHEGVSRRLLPLVSERSFARPVLTRRIVGLANKLDAGDAETVKKAEAIQDIMLRKPQDKGMHPGYLAGLAAALYALFGPHATGLAQGIGKAMADYPYILLPLGMGALAGYKVLSTPTQTGFYNVDDSLAGLYNKSYQSRFAEMQARPVTVIKTGAAKADPELAKKIFYGVPAIYLGSKVLKAREESHPEKQPGTISHLIASNPELLSVGLIGEHLAGRPVSQRVGKAIESGKRIIKSASIRDLEFLEAVPESERELIWDVAILDAADRINKKVLGG